MPATNADIAALFTELADLLELQGANPFRVRAYRRAAEVVEGLGRPLAEAVEADEDLTRLEGIGADLAAKVAEIVRTGTLAMLEQERSNVPKGVLDLLRIESLGPKRAKALHEALGIRSLDDLKKAAQAEKVRHVKGFGEKTEKTILAHLERLTKSEKRFRIHDVTPIAEAYVAHLQQVPDTGNVTVAGSYRRRRETVGDLDILAVAADAAALMEAFTSYGDVSRVVSKGKTRATVRLKNGLQVDLRVVPAESEGAALHYFTGSKAHNIHVRRLAVAKKIKLNEYGLFEGDRRIGGETEQEVFDRVGLAYVPPELREDRGEVEAAKQRTLPSLIEVKDIRGDLHCHTKATDGRDTVLAMARAAEAIGHEYLAITDHTRRNTIANGMDVKRIKRHLGAIDQANARLERLTLLKSAEVDILKGGKLDLPDDVLDELDLAVCSIHFPEGLSRKAQTERVLKAMGHPAATILGHPMGRLIGRRDPYQIDMQRVLQQAADDGWFVEVNAQPKRLDLDDLHTRQAKEHRVKVAISTDAHSTDQLGNMRYGVEQARRGWLEKKDVVNTRTLRQLERLIGR